MAKIILVVPFFVVDLSFPPIFILYFELIHLSYKIELIKFGGKTVENAYALLVAFFLNKPCNFVVSCDQILAQGSAAAASVLR
jgi:hypothetical protein